MTFTKRKSEALIRYTSEEWGDDFYAIHALYGPHRIAYLRYTFDRGSGEITISDLCIQKTIHYFSFTRRILIGLVTGHFPPVSFRRHGIGTELLARLMAWARLNGARSISGRLVMGDIEGQPWLPEWYEKRGFTVTLPVSDQKPGHIVLPLDGAANSDSQRR